MRSDRPKVSEHGRVIMFRPNQAAAGRGRKLTSNWVPTKAPVEGLRKCQRVREDEDGRHGMIVNVLGLVFCIALAIAGVWLANEFAEMKRIQECVLSGRNGCVPLKIPGASG
jgi:hypothetical protein